MVSPAPFVSTVWLLKAVYALVCPGDCSVLQFVSRMEGESTLVGLPGGMEGVERACGTIAARHPLSASTSGCGRKGSGLWFTYTRDT